MPTKRIPVGFAPEQPRSEPLTLASAEPDARARRARHRSMNAADGTRQLLVSGAWTMLAGLLAGLLAATAFGGIGPQGAHSNAGWLTLMIAMMSVPFAILLLLLGGAKWLRNLGLSKAAAQR